jgi:hypothetical protein
LGVGGAVNLKPPTPVSLSRDQSVTFTIIEVSGTECADTLIN